MKRMTITFILFFSLLSSAGLPKLDFITSRMAQKHGNGSYEVKKDVVFYNQNTTIGLIETWKILDSKNMLLTVQAKPPLADKISFEILYKNDRKYFNEGKGIKNEKLNAEFYMPFLILRNSKDIRSLLYRNKMIPASGIPKSVIPASLDGVDNKNQQYVNLSRVGGKLTYGVGTSINENNSSSGMWIEQDSFNIVKIKFPSKSVLKAKSYKTYSGRFSLPSRYNLSWGGYHMESNILSVTRLSKKPKLSKTKLKASSILVDIEIIKDFYERFR